VASPGWSRLSTHIVGDNGDAMWQLSVQRWNLAAFRAGHLPWDPPMFFPTRGTYAYSDPMIPQSLVAAPFRAAGASPALAMNAVLLLSWVAAFVLAWRLLRRIGLAPSMALLGACAWTFSELRVATVSLFQLATAGAFIPLVLDRLLAALDRPTPARGLGLGAASAVAILAALYYAPLLAVACGVAAVGWFMATRQRPTRQHVIAGACAALVVGVLVAPLAIRYRAVHERDGLRRAPEAAFSASAADVGAVASRHELLASAPGLRKAANGERALFPGFAVVVAVPVTAIALARRRARRRPTPEAVAVFAAGAAAYLLAVGTRFSIGGLNVPAPLAFLDELPVFDALRAPVRFATLGHLALVGGACLLLDRVVVRGRGLVVAILIGGTLAAAGSWLPVTKVPEARAWTTVNQRLRALPDGAVVELPMLHASDGVAGPRIEAPRLLLAGIDGHPRVNGYSGYEPPGYGELAAALNTFPAEPAIAALRSLDVRYVVLRTTIVGYHADGRRGFLATYGTLDPARLRITGAHLRTIRDRLPADVTDLGRTGDAVLLEVRPRNLVRVRGRP
jgi:hypothetical protein